METKEMCKDCGGPFVITDAEKEWFAQKGFDLPKRCKKCRIAKKKRYE